MSRHSSRKTNIFDNLLQKANEKSVQQLEELVVENTIHMEIPLVSLLFGGKCYFHSFSEK